jgi:hypothetical protein
MTARAHVEFDPYMFGVRLAVRRDGSGPSGVVLKWEQPTVEPVTEAGTVPDPATWLHLQEDDARAIYEALADHFGHAGHDTRALRKDYDAERARVDKLIANLIGGRS